MFVLLAQLSLIDTDLQLMRQFLLLNERIEDLKWNHKMRSYKLSSDSWQTTGSSLATESATGSSEHVTASHSAGSRCLQGLATGGRSVTSFGSEYLHLKYPSPSELSLIQSCSSVSDTLNPCSHPDLRLADLRDVTSDFDSETDDADTCLTPRAADVTNNIDPLRTPTGDAPSAFMTTSKNKSSTRVTSSFVWEPLARSSEQVRVKKSSTMTSTASNESASTVDSGIDGDVTTRYKTHL